ncbi:MAG TPA: hypothetical protein VEU74_11970 [Gemmatimonadales bacterium]|nr:hypothetical protein [Gemmatimonadales bacterium]
MSCPICGAKCVCRKRGEDGRCCSCHKHKTRTPQQAQAHAAHDAKQKDAVNHRAAVADLLAELQPTSVQYRDAFTYPGLGDRPVVTDLVILGDGPGRVVIATERSDNPGASITNTIEKLAAALMSETGWLLGDFVLVEHYPAHRYGADLGRSLDQVSFERMWSGVLWRHLSIDALRALTQNVEAGVLDARDPGDEDGAS